MPGQQGETGENGPRGPPGPKGEKEKKKSYGKPKKPKPPVYQFQKPTIEFNLNQILPNLFFKPRVKKSTVLKPVGPPRKSHFRKSTPAGKPHKKPYYVNRRPRFEIPKLHQFVPNIFVLPQLNFRAGKQYHSNRRSR